MRRQQRILADFGDFSLECEDLNGVLTEACRLVGEALGTELAKVIEIEEEDQTLFVRAGVGWQPGVVGQVRLPMGERSSETYAVEIGEPVITPDLRKEDRFDFPDFLKEAGVVGIVNVPIFLPGRKPYGLLQVDSREEWEPDEETTAFLRTYATILGPVIDRLNKVHDLQRAAETNETLLHELQHRIKNNIGAISSLVRMRVKQAQSEDARQELGIVGDRIEALRLVHEQVYAAKSGDQVSLRSYVTLLLEGLLELHKEIPVQLDARIEDVEIKSDTAIPLGLILNEFTTNSLKYAFDGDRGGAENIILVQAYKHADRLRVQIRDNGKGLPAETQAARPGFGTGRALIEGLARQIRGVPEWKSDKGTSLSLDFPHRN
ncbi:sensor histidine kinase [Sphingomonas sp. HMP9]|uniref:sensor histidine kinase n=1 Tax=Sphingomonas sp. HMP9 TaxID=1517554 RepID=UPI0018D832E4|nr:histidine kinase dimerization/phosphoacceptor domain -containing protein [Sphingomonas sp. HMP9]